VYLHHFDAFRDHGLRIGFVGVTRNAADLPLLGELGMG